MSSYMNLDRPKMVCVVDSLGNILSANDYNIVPIVDTSIRWPMSSSSLVYEEGPLKGVGLNYLVGMSGKDSIPVLEHAINALSVYWSTVDLLQTMLKAARSYPHGVWSRSS